MLENYKRAGLPISNDELDAVALAHDASEGLRMVAAIHGYIGRFVCYPSEHAHTAHTLWIVHAHLMDRWESTPRLCFLSPEPASGKTRAVEVTEQLVPNPVCAINISPAYLFRKVGAEEGATILFDEIDTVFGPKAKENEEIRGLLNAGHRRGAVAGCAVKGKEIVAEEISAYAPVVLAGLGWLPDTIMSRSVIVPMRRRLPGEHVEQFRHRIHSREGALIRSQIETWARQQPKEIEWPEMPKQVQERDADVWEPLIAVAELIGGEWPEKARAAAVALVTSSKEVEPSLGIRLLADPKQVFEGEVSMSSKDILARLYALEEAPWADIRGKPLDERGMAHRLKQYTLKSKVIRFGCRQARGYERSELIDVWARYLPQPPATSVTSVASVTKPATVTDVTHVTQTRGLGMRTPALIQMRISNRQVALKPAGTVDRKAISSPATMAAWLLGYIVLASNHG